MKDTYFDFLQLFEDFFQEHFHVLVVYGQVIKAAKDRPIDEMRKSSYQVGVFVGCDLTEGKFELVLI